MKDKKLSLTQLEIISKMISNNAGKPKRKRPKYIRKVTCQVWSLSSFEEPEKF